VVTYEQMQIMTHLSVPETCRELVEKWGVQQILDYLPTTVLHKQDDYELILLRPSNGMKYLKMKNPSTGQWHLEAVHPGMISVGEALNWRNRGWFRHADKLT
jgi:hypothetical protein